MHFCAAARAPLRVRRYQGPLLRRRPFICRRAGVRMGRSLPGRRGAAHAGSHARNQRVISARGCLAAAHDGWACGGVFANETAQSRPEFCRRQAVDLGGRASRRRGMRPLAVGVRPLAVGAPSTRDIIHNLRYNASVASRLGVGMSRHPARWLARTCGEVRR